MNKQKRNITLTFLLFIFNFNLLAQPVIYTAKKIYTADTAFSEVECFVTEADKIIFTGSMAEAKNKFPNATNIHFKNKFIFPGFIDAHCHFYAYAKGLKECNLIGTKSEKDVVKRLKKYSKKTKSSWLIGRGWDQNDWAEKQYPTMAMLDKAFPNKPVFLKRIDGHAAWINTAAMKAIGLDVSKKPEGGEFIFNADGSFSGIAIDNAVDLISAKVPDIPENEKLQGMLEAQKHCLAFGLTTLDEAGLSISQMKYLESLQRSNLLHLRFYTMLTASEESFAWIAQNGIQTSPNMRISAVKFYLDGALGSRGALMKKDYCDRLGHKGLQLSSTNEFMNYSRFLYTQGYQVCVHAIGDSANKIALQLFNKLLPTGADMRWRIEHAQIVDTADFVYFKNKSIIPSIQPTHATSDAPWVLNRICEHRSSGAYAYESLRKKAGMVALGTDFPVEGVSTIHTFYSAVARKDANGNLENPFLPHQALSRKDALWGMTLWAAYSNLQEHEKGSIEVGKLADFVVLDSDLMTMEEKKIPKTKIKATYIGGIKRY